MKQNRKVAIASYWDSMSNYGQVLQGVALQYVLRNLGYEPFTIRYNMTAEKPHSKSLNSKIYKLIHDDLSLMEHIKRRLKFLYGKHSNIPSKKPNYEQRGFNDFRKDYLQMSSKIYNSFYELDSPELLECHALITGSDQVWTAASGPERRKYLLLEFARQGQKRISYAASFGRERIIFPEEQEEYKRELALFDALSVREENGVQLCKKMGSNAICVLDPTLLLTRNEWLSYFKLSNKRIANKKKKAFVYTLKANHELTNKIIQHLTNSGYDYDYVCSDDRAIDPRANLEATPYQWIQGIANSDLVVTTSFHGTIFALNFNIPVISVGKNGLLTDNQNQRMYSIMSKLGVSDFFTNEYSEKKISNMLNAKIDWIYVNDILRTERDRSMRFLNDALTI